MKLLKDLFLTKHFFTALIILVLLFVIAYVFPTVFFVPQFLLLAFIIVFVVEVIVLFNVSKGIEAERIVADKLSIGDENKISIAVKSYYNFETKVLVIDEVPIQFQLRDTQFNRALKPLITQNINYTLRPVERGNYTFKWINVFATGFF